MRTDLSPPDTFQALCRVLGQHVLSHGLRLGEFSKKSHNFHRGKHLIGRVKVSFPKASLSA